MAAWLAPLARAYGAIYKDQRGRDYVGMRDYYELLKNLRRTLAESGAELTPDTLTFALMRNFGGRRDVAARVNRVFGAECFGGAAAAGPPPSALALVRASLADDASRYLMLLTRNGVALPLLFSCGLVARGGGALDALSLIHI